MSRYFNRDTTPSQDNYKSALPDLIYLPLNIGRFIPRQQTPQNQFIQPPSNSVNLTDWINHNIDNGTIIIPAGADGNGIYSGNGTIPNNTIARLGNSFGIEPTGTANQYNLYLTPTSTQIGTATANNTYAFRLTLTETTATFTDGINYGGLKYAADYSANFTDLSLVTKQYVDDLLGGNGIYGGSDQIAEDVTATVFPGSFFRINYSTDTGSLIVDDSDGSTLISNSDDSGQLHITNDNTVLSGASYTLDLNNSTEAQFTDGTGDGRGLQYSANYFATFVPRSLVDKYYVDTLLDGRKWKQAVQVATTASITLSGEQTIDGILTSSSRVLVKNQASPAQNGIYTTGAGAWTRTTDADLAPELDGAAVSVLEGTANANTQWYQTEQPVVIGTDPNLWVLIGNQTYTADGEGIELIGNEFQIELDGNSLSKSSAGLKVNTPTGWTGLSKKTGSFSIGSVGAFTQTIDVSPFASSDILPFFRNSNNEEIELAVNTTLSVTSITVSGFIPNDTVPYTIKYILLA